MKKVKWCVIGAGGIADRRTIPAIVGSDECELVGVMDKSGEIARKVGEKYGVPYFTSEAEMLDAVDADAVYIGTPVFCHAEQSRAALSREVAVFVEKPITLSSSDARALVEEFRAARVPLSVGYMMKYHNLNEKARELVLGGEIGKPVNVRAQFSCWYPDIEGAWRQKKALGGGGAFMDLGVHCAELIEFILGEKIVEVKTMAATQSFKYEVEDSAIIVFRTESGILGHIDVNFNIPDAASESKLEIYGDAGYIIARGTLGQTEGGELTHLYTPGGDYSAIQDRVVGHPVTYVGEGKNLYTKQIENFNKQIISGEPDYTYADVAVHIQELCDLIYADAEKQGER